MCTSSESRDGGAEWEVDPCMRSPGSRDVTVCGCVVAWASVQPCAAVSVNFWAPYSRAWCDAESVTVPVGRLRGCVRRVHGRVVVPTAPARPFLCRRAAELPVPRVLPPESGGEALRGGFCRSEVGVGELEDLVEVGVVHGSCNFPVRTWVTSSKRLRQHGCSRGILLFSACGAAGRQRIVSLGVRRGSQGVLPAFGRGVRGLTGCGTGGRAVS